MELVVVVARAGGDFGERPVWAVISCNSGSKSDEWTCDGILTHLEDALAIAKVGWKQKSRALLPRAGDGCGLKQEGLDAGGVWRRRSCGGRTPENLVLKRAPACSLQRS